ncbi:hypothetical protein [Granulicella mallensis]|uniref:ApeA N-terminal domain-containing protein n=1 Tax=Granulicella mallensis (strain ATCC BAA-1857 / DSM 23137 / MP5ACTX8) TaxID=682795 RepID=G8NWB1_GRAMM|nr:hypothetical protein [Granulicella mallensis]AEU36623.1 hypothetical protein AciX8_2305 [Granulicella mallensis MP5ACTX8]
MDLSEVTPQLNDWFTISGEYSGDATLTADDNIVLTGTGRVSWSDSDRCKILIEIDPASATKAMQILSQIDVFKALQVVCADGVFSAGEVHVSKNDTSIGASIEVRLELITLAAEFTPKDAVQGVYWVVPLVNFVSDFRKAFPELDRHPLRMYPTPPVPEGMSESDAIRAESIAHSKNSLIAFTWNATRCFIEALPDYKQRADDLHARKLPSAATAMMVGGVSSLPWSTVDEIESWLPTDILYALCVATGNFVGFPFVEVRGEDGRLARRFHIATARRRYSPVKPLIHEIFDSRSGATGALIDSFLALPAAKRRYIRVAAEHLTSAGQNKPDLENAYDHLVRGFESLTKVHNLSSEDLIAGIDVSHRAAVSAILQRTSVEMVSLAQTIRAASDDASAVRVERVAARVKSASQREAMFGLAVSALCRMFNLEDEAVINSFYTLHPRTDGISEWATVLSKYRGGVIHVGFLDLATSAAIQDVLRYNQHLHDLLARIVLLEMGYVGTYLPGVLDNFISKELCWVTASTSPGDLGFA